MNSSSVDHRRRQILALVAMLLSGGLSPVPRAASPGSCRGAAIVSAVVADPQAAQRLGRAYLAVFPAEADLEGLLERLGAALAPDSAETAAVSESMFALFDRVVRGEYAHGEVVGVDGWLLSRSEARLYALSVLYRGD